MSKSLQLVLGQVAHAGIAVLQGAGGQSQLDLQPQSDLLQLQPEFEPQIGQAVAHGAGQAAWHGARLGVEHGQAAITELIEHVAIPTAIAAATVSFLIVIFNLFVLCVEID